MRNHASRLKVLTWLLSALPCFVASPLMARTVTIKAQAIDAFAALSDKFPHNGWAAYQVSATFAVSNPLLTAPTTSYLVRYSFDQIPKGQRITRAEWVIPASPQSVSTISVWRLFAEWGLGVCHQYRMTYPEKLEWSVAGANGKSVDRATNPTGSGKFGKGTSLVTINVTQDVELWYSGATPNRGWLLTFDSSSVLLSPTHTVERFKWELHITYEPE